MLSRSGRALAALVFTVMVAIPLIQLRRRAEAESYREYYFEHIPQHLQDQGQPGIYNNTLYTTENEGTIRSQLNVSSPCENFPNLDGIMLVMKTGATEAYEKLPTQLLTNLQCVKDFLLFSDLEQQIGPYHVYNVLDRVEPRFKARYEEFKLYEAQQNCPVSQKECTPTGQGAWELDKFKFLHMVIRTWEMRPGRQWYFFAEADTYIVWNNLVHWLRERANPKDHAYVGSVALLDGFPFAHGGSGYVVSGRLMQKMVELIPNLAAKYDEKANGLCCGDVLLAQAVDEVGTTVKQAHPMFNGEKPNTLPFGPGYWCEPIMTMHHMNSEEVSSVWQYEQSRTRKDLMQIKELYHAFVKPHMMAYRKDWSNFAEDTCYVDPNYEVQGDGNGNPEQKQKRSENLTPVQSRAHMSAAACSKVCEADGLDISEDEYAALSTERDRGEFIRAKYEKKVTAKPEFMAQRKCFQWQWRQGICCTGRSFKLGKPFVDTETPLTSGWFVRGIEEWIEAQGDCPLRWQKPVKPIVQ